DYGGDDTYGTNETGGADVAKLTLRSTVAMLSYATSVGSRVRVGLSYKYARQAFTCSGLCDVSSYSGASSALDAGVQLVLPTAVPITVGGALRNLGPD